MAACQRGDGGDPAAPEDPLRGPALAPRLVENLPLKVAAVALTNRIARIAWALLYRGERYRSQRRSKLPHPLSIQ